MKDELWEDYDDDDEKDCDKHPFDCPSFHPDLEDMEETGTVECAKCNTFVDSERYKKWVKNQLLSK